MQKMYSFGRLGEKTLLFKKRLFKQQVSVSLQVGLRSGVSAVIQPRTAQFSVAH